MKRTTIILIVIVIIVLSLLTGLVIWHTSKSTYKGFCCYGPPYQKGQDDDSVCSSCNSWDCSSDWEGGCDAKDGNTACPARSCPKPKPPGPKPKPPGPKPPGPKPPGGKWEKLKLTSFWDCSMGCTDNGQSVMGSSQVAPINVAPMMAPAQYKKYDEDIWMVGAMSDDLIKGLRGDSVNGLNGNPGCGRCILMKGDKYKKDWTAVVMAMDQFTPGEADDAVQLDQAVPGWDDHEYSIHLDNCPKGYDSPNYPKFNITRDEAAEQVGNTSACNIKDTDLKSSCQLFSQWTGGNYDGSGEGKYQYVECPSKFVELVSKSLDPHKQSPDDQRTIRNEVLK